MTGRNDRQYLGTHPWITFQIDLRKPAPEVWMLLGEARSKVEHLSRALLRPEVAREMNEVFISRGAHATTAIEGNTLTEEQVAAIVAGGGPKPSPSQEYLHREVQNIVDTFNVIVEQIVPAGDGVDLTPAVVMDFNRRVLDGVHADDEHPGQIRRGSVVVGNVYRGAPAEDCGYLLERLCQWLADGFAAPTPAWRVPYAILRSVAAHLYLAWIHPFDNGNGRTARLMEFQILVAAGVPLPAAHLLSSHYNLTRDEYYRQLDLASRTGDPLPFVAYALQGLVDGLGQQLDRVWEQQYADRWEQFIYETFGGEVTTRAARRRLELVKRLSEHAGALTRRELVNLSTTLAVAYHGTTRTLSRDLNALRASGLIVSAGYGRWRAARERILAFRPARRDEG